MNTIKQGDKKTILIKYNDLQKPLSNLDDERREPSTNELDGEHTMPPNLIDELEPTRKGTDKDRVPRNEKKVDYQVLSVTKNGEHDISHKNKDDTRKTSPNKDGEDQKRLSKDQAGG